MNPVDLIGPILLGIIFLIAICWTVIAGLA